MAKFVTADEAAALIPDNALVCGAGMAVMGLAEDVIRATEKRFLETGHPCNLGLMYGAHQGDNPITTHGWDHWAHDGMLTNWCGGFLGASPKIMAMCNENKIQAWCPPMGNVIQLYNEIAANRPGLFTKIGLKTYADPRVEGCRMNEVTTEPLMELKEIDGEEWLFFKSRKIDVALIRGTTVDSNGNLTFDEESINSEALALATATKNTGGIVIAQAKYHTAAGSLHPRSVRVPGVLIDYVVMCETPMETHTQNEVFYYNPALCGNTRADLSAQPKVPMSEAKVIARRAAMELFKGTTVNLGIGNPVMIASVCNEEGVGDYFTLTSEAGIIGGVGILGKAFGNALNPECIMTMQDQFAWYTGGGLGIAFLGLAETDESGNINVSKFGVKSNGPGGFIDITQPTKKVCFIGTFTAGKLATEIKDGKITITQEGKNKKFVKTVKQITFSGDYAKESGQEVMYITERAVFKLTEEGMTLTEIAPGIDLQKDILDKMDFAPVISPDLKVMDSAIFQEDWGGLKAILDAKG